jgi:hypothetical protein
VQPPSQGLLVAIVGEAGHISLMPSQGASCGQGGGWLLAASREAEGATAASGLAALGRNQESLALESRIKTTTNKSRTGS